MKPKVKCISMVAVGIILGVVFHELFHYLIHIDNFIRFEIFPNSWEIARIEFRCDGVCDTTVEEIVAYTITTAVIATSMNIAEKQLHHADTKAPSYPVYIGELGVDILKEGVKQ